MTTTVRPAVTRPRTEPAPARNRRIDIGIAVAIGIAVLIVQPVSAMLHHPFWLDEAWVANLLRAPLSLQLRSSSSTPIGWGLLLRLVPWGGEQRFRLVTLGFSVATGVLAYFFVRGLAWRSQFDARVAGIIGAAAVVLARTSLIRNDLKQYTCDATCALVLVILTRRAESRRDRRSLIYLAAAAVVMIVFSTVAAMVAAAMFAGLLGSAALARNWARAREVLVSGAATGAILFGYLILVVVPSTNATLDNFWHQYYVTGTPWHMISTAWGHFTAMHAFLGAPSIVGIAFVLFGLVVLHRMGHDAIAIGLVALWVEMFVLGLARRYPFLDVRTSHFMMVLTIAVGSVGFTWLALAFTRDRRPALISVAVVAIALMTLGGRSDLHKFSRPDDDTRTQARYVAATRRPGDVVVVGFAAGWGFTYYWPGPQPKTYPADTSVANGFVARVGDIDAFYGQSRHTPAIDATMRDAIARWKALGGTGRMFIVRSNLNPPETQRWANVFRTLHVNPVAASGPPEPTLVLDAPALAAADLASADAG